MFTKTEETILNALPKKYKYNFMWEYGLDPADLLMEEKDESNEKEISR